MERLQRILAARGVASRRAAEELITAGRVSVNGQIVTALGAKADPENAVILVDGNPIKRPRPRYLILNKPSGYITTVKDERDRWTVMQLIHVSERVYPVGRLDRDTEGLLLFTNDGDLANRVMHPKYGLAKEYHVLTMSRPTPATLQRLRDGVVIDGKTIVPKEIRILRETREGLILTVTVHEGVYHLVRRLMEAGGIPVARLRRVRIGPLGLANLAVGESRDLTMGELATLMEAVHIDQTEERSLSGPTPHRPGARKNRPRPEVPARTDGSDARPRPGRANERPEGDRRPPAPFQNRAPRNRNGQPRDDRDRTERPFTDRQGFTRDARPQDDERDQPRPPFQNRQRFERDERPRDYDRNQNPAPFPNRQRFERDAARPGERTPFPARRPVDERGPRPPRQFIPRDEESSSTDQERKPFNDQRGRHQNYRQARDERAEPLKGSEGDGAPSRPERTPNDRFRPKPTSPHRDRRSGGGGQNDRRPETGRPRRRDLP